MFECRACLQRCLRAIYTDALPPTHALHRTSILTRRELNTTALRKASTATATNGASNNGLVPGKQPIDHTGENGVNPDGNGALSKTPKKHLQLELKYLSDKVKFAEHVHYILRNNQPDKALDLCRLASKDKEVTVAWNHCVDWHMRNNKIDAAIKIYNEMKKRAQFPDSYTYSILLRGLSQPHRHAEPVKQSNVTKAVSIYNSMSSPTSRVKPSNIHTNAVLQVCSVAQDMDALWGIVAKLPTSKGGSPDHITYSILLNAIRGGAVGGNPEDASREEIAARRNKAVQEGRRLWRDVIIRWRSGEVKIDEDLACAMARLLLVSKKMEDWDAILDLVQQTSNIERLLPPLGHPDRHAQHVPQEDGDIASAFEQEEDSEGYSDVPAVKVFHSVQPHTADTAHPNRPTSLAYVQPGAGILSVLISACTALRIPKTATGYWNLLTTKHRVTPDMGNFHAQLKLLAFNRNSGQAAVLLKDAIPAAGLEPNNQTFRIAMSVCMRDSKNHHVLTNARTIVDVMEQTQPNPDIHTLMQYLNLALITDNAEKIVATLDRLDPLVHILRSRVTYGAAESSLTPAEHVVEKQEIIRFLQVMVGVIDTLMNRGMVARDEYKHWHARRSNLTQFIGKARNAVEKQKGDLDTRPAEMRMRARAKEAGRRERKTKDAREDQGDWEPTTGGVERTLKIMRERDRPPVGAAQRERERARAIERHDDLNRARFAGIEHWNFAHAKAQGKLRAADSPMELSER